MQGIFVDKASYGLNAPALYSGYMNAIDCAGLDIMFGKEANDNSRLFVRLSGAGGKKWYQVNLNAV